VDFKIVFHDISLAARQPATNALMKVMWSQRSSRRVSSKATLNVFQSSEKVTVMGYVQRALKAVTNCGNMCLSVDCTVPIICAPRTQLQNRLPSYHVLMLL